ncbi:MAG TPA: TonB-dependent receptor, partial [Prevotellaceae bacterium]|nr:TonB-dependent receptor [Prevotellaceae bacterium]
MATVYVKRVGITLLSVAACALPVWAQSDTTVVEHEMKTVTVRQSVGTHSRHRTDNTEVIGLGQLRRAACCNLGESFTTNPSVDVSYSDAATGA